MDDERKFLTPDEAKMMLPDGESIHTFRNAPGVLIGADWDRTDILEAIDKAKTREVGGDQCTRMGHGLVIDDGSYLFIETRKESSDERPPM